MPRCLIFSGGVTVMDSQQRHLQQQARRLGFADLRACLQALLHEGWSMPQLGVGHGWLDRQLDRPGFRR